jgi:thiol-disulfide isomerase/thioredoxin
MEIFSLPARPARHMQPITLLLALIALALPACSSEPASAQGVGPEIGSQLPRDLALEDLAGNAVTLGDYLTPGRPALIEIWASWCENCEALQPQLDAVLERWDGDVDVIAVAVAVAQSQRRVQRHIDEHGHTYPFVWDAKGNAVRALNAATTSIVIVADGEGRVVYTGVGGDQDLVATVAQVLQP